MMTKSNSFFLLFAGLSLVLGGCPQPTEPTNSSGTGNRTSPTKSRQATRTKPSKRYDNIPKKLLKVVDAKEPADQKTVPHEPLVLAQGSQPTGPIAPRANGAASQPTARRATPPVKAPKPRAQARQKPKPPSEAEKKRGFRFPSFKVPFFQYTPKKRYAKKTMDFASIVGKEAIALFYFLPKHGPSITELKAFAATSKVFQGKIRFLAVTKAQNAKEAAAAYKTMRRLKIKIPVLLDEKGLMAYVMLTRSVPAYSLISKAGYLFLSGAGSLTEKVNAEHTLMSVLQLAATGKSLNFMRAPGYSPNPYDLIGKTAPGFVADSVLSKESFTLKGSPGKLPLLLVFWSVSCPHCQKTMPILDAYAKERKGKLNLVTLLGGVDEKVKAMVQVYVESKKLESLKVFVSKEKKTPVHYRVMKVPTLYVIDPKGIVRGVHLGGGKGVKAYVDGVIAKMGL